MKLYKSRTNSGALTAEYASTMYVMFTFLVFPVINYATLGLRSFFLWYAANQAVMTACKAKTYYQNVYIPTTPPNTLFYGAYTLGRARAQTIQQAFGGFTFLPEPINGRPNPNVEILVEPIDPNSTVGTKVYWYGAGAPMGLGNAPDTSQYVVTCRVTIKANVYPLVSVPFLNVPGLSGPVEIDVAAQSQYENVPGLQI